MLGGYFVKHLLDLQNLAPDEINTILDNAVPMKQILNREIKKVPTLRGKTVVTLFYEPSTRTKTSFELAAKYLSADTVSISAPSSSVVKGESLIDTAHTIKAAGADVVVLRHPAAGAPYLISRRVDASVINAGDGMHEHPSQALLDIFTIKEIKGSIAGLKVVIVGDILHSRVARSNVWGLSKLGAEVHLVGPATLLPPGIENLGVQVSSDLDAVLPGADVIYVLRLQLERQNQGLLPSLQEYASLYGINSRRVELAQDDVLIMHPGPLNRGVEISNEVAEHPNAVINQQVTNGVAVRMALLYLLSVGDVSNETAN
ncbi:MAG: aspartate carbamoyltransferase catalytic subunit [Peptococcaceae bacterium]|nr:aspartate carbamoyltransferase catalytic subunit [Peptococcaceae bacterium]